MQEVAPDKVIAIMYDFDKTLCDKDMQEYSFIPLVNKTPEEFWGETGVVATQNDMDKILAYMYYMIVCAKKENIKLTRELLNKCGENVILFRGVLSYFKRINEYASRLGFKLEHYIISSGLKEMISGTRIAKEFTEIYACDFHYDENGEADFQANVVNYTTKTQFLFRISKGVLDKSDDVALNSFTPDSERRVPYNRMIYIGDGLTDVPCMRLIKKSGGKSIAVYPKHKIDRVKQLLLDQRCDFIAETDYSEGGELDHIIKMIIDQIYVNELMLSKIDSQFSKVNKLK